VYHATEGLREGFPQITSHPPPDPRFLASLGALSPVGLVNHATEGLREGILISN
jgi:hypothetical protein